MLSFYTEYSGADFNKYHKQNGTKFYKFLHNNLIHNDFTYTKGLNIDTEQFNPIRGCSKGGLYFCEESKCHMWFNMYGTKLALIEIPDNARVYVDHGNFKADCLIIKEIIDFKDIDVSFWVNIIPKDGLALCCIKEQYQTNDICTTAVQQNGLALKHVINQNNEICMIAVKQNWIAIRYVINQNEEICKIAAQKHSEALGFIEEQYQTNDVCKLAIQNNWKVFEYVKNQNNDICEFAVQQNGLLLRHVKNQTPEICILAVQQNGLALQYVKEQTPELCVLAVQRNRLASQYVNDEMQQTFQQAWSKLWC